ncbi:MAG TPA: formylglycine-generating enzyme family protein [Gemmataceae bacterium]|jgi:formylglycine-generating enzyme required for sulfatase activity
MQTPVTTVPRWLLLAALLLLGLGMLPGSPSAGEEKKSSPKRVSVDLGGGVSMKLVRIPAGKFKMGTPKSEIDSIRKQLIGSVNKRFADEIAATEKQHEVEITKPFYMGVYEVTQAEYEKVMEKNPSAFSRNGPSKKEVSGQDTTQFPVEMVTWDDAMEFCRTLSKRFKKNFDLPTESEWEYACRAGTTTAFCYGNTLSPKLAQVGGSFGDAEEVPITDRPKRTTRVGSFKPNAFGLHDMHGNVSEWCKDWYGKDYYGKSPARDPQGPERGDEDQRVLRGGEWLSSPMGGRSASRHSKKPTERFHYIGFRVVVRTP